MSNRKNLYSVAPIDRVEAFKSNGLTMTAIQQANLPGVKILQSQMNVVFLEIPNRADVAKLQKKLGKAFDIERCQTIG